MNATIRLVSTNRAAVERFGTVYRVNFTRHHEIVAVASAQSGKTFPQDRAPKLWRDLQEAIDTLKQED